MDRIVTSQGVVESRYRIMDRPTAKGGWRGGAGYRAELSDQFGRVLENCSHLHKLASGAWPCMRRLADDVTAKEEEK